MSAAWYLSPLASDGMLQMLEQNGIAPPETTDPSVAPTPRQVFRALESFPDFLPTIRRSERTPPGKEPRISIQIDLRRADRSYVMELLLLRVTDDDSPALPVFSHYASMDDIRGIAQELANACGPLVLWHDSGAKPIVFERAIVNGGSDE